MALNEVTLAAMLCSRLCHDLVGPASAVLNGLELAASDPETRDEAMDMLGHSAGQVSHRLQFFRGAYGVASGLAFATARHLTQQMFGEAKLKVSWPAEPAGSDTRFPAGAPKIVLNMVLLATDLLTRGGEVAVRLAPDAVRAEVAATGAALREDLVRLLSRPGDGEVELSPRTVQPLFLQALTAAAAARLACHFPRPGEALLVAEF